MIIKKTGRKSLVGLEIRTSKAFALVGEILPDRIVNIIGIGNYPSRGIKGGVNDLKLVVKCVQPAINQAELIADC